MILVSGGQGGDLDQVVGEDPLSGPGFRSFEVVQAGAVPTVSTFQGADPTLATGPPFHGSTERPAVFDLLPGGTGSALAGYHHVANSEVGQCLVDRGLAVSAVRCHGPGARPVRFFTRLSLIHI